MDIVFDIEQLTLKDRKVYDAMNEAEKEQFQKTWCLLKQQETRLRQQMAHSKERRSREQKVLADKERKARTRRLIERGAIIEGFIPDSEKMTNDEFVSFLQRTLGYASSLQVGETLWSGSRD